METLELKSTKTKWKKSVVELNSKFEQGKRNLGTWRWVHRYPVWGREKKKDEKWTKPHRPVAHQKIYQYDHTGSSRGKGGEKRAGEK